MDTSKTIFELYGPWKHGDINKDLQFLPDVIKTAFESLYNGNAVELQGLLNATDLKTLVNYVDLQGRTALHLACAISGHFDVVQLLLLYGN